ncbi:hypothetical protein B0O99DRAFT_602041 [Bisporella sp. PMI_857]|nr:hypothetical protein B0O99DRAFT_602041 [Bisporella sp. PMI_857]
MARLGDVPSEIIARICFYCNSSSILRFLRTCKDYYTLVTTLSSLWRDRLNSVVGNIKFPADAADYYLVYLAWKGIWKIERKIYAVSPEAKKTKGELHSEPLQISNLSGIPCFTTVDAPSEDGKDYGGTYYRYYPNGRDPFIHGILTDGRDLLLGFKTKDGSICLGIVECTNLSRRKIFKLLTLREKGWPRCISNAAYHSGLLILIGEYGPSLWYFDWVTETLEKISFKFEAFPATVDAVAINQEYYCFAVLQRVWLFSRRSHSTIAVFTGMSDIAVDVTFSGNYILALTRTEGVYQWDLRTNPPFGSLYVPHMKHIPSRNWNGFHGEYEDILGWRRRARLLSSPNASY